MISGFSSRYLAIYMYVYKYIYIYINTYVRRCKYIHIYTYLYIYIYIFICIYTASTIYLIYDFSDFHKRVGYFVEININSSTQAHASPNTILITFPSQF